MAAAELAGEYGDDDAVYNNLPPGWADRPQVAAVPHHLFADC